MNVYTFLSNELLKGTINTNTLFTVQYKKKQYLSNIKECTEIFGGLLVSKFEKRKEPNGNEMENSFLIHAI